MVHELSMEAVIKSIRNSNLEKHNKFKNFTECKLNFYVTLISRNIRENNCNL